MLPKDLLRRIDSQIFCWQEGSKDALVWAATYSGRFTISSAAILVDPDPGTSWVFKQVWVDGLPLKFSCLVWRVLHYTLPISDVLVKFNVQESSRCYCYRESSSETLQHVLSLGHTSSVIWRRFEVPFDVSSHGRLVRDRCMCW